jgi:hypothetical protein
VNRENDARAAYSGRAKSRREKYVGAMQGYLIAEPEGIEE